jgi:hypothetical protein
MGQKAAAMIPVTLAPIQQFGESLFCWPRNADPVLVINRTALESQRPEKERRYNVKLTSLAAQRLPAAEGGECLCRRHKPRSVAPSWNLGAKSA